MKAYLEGDDEHIPSGLLKTLLDAGLVYPCDQGDDDDGPYVLYSVVDETQNGWEAPPHRKAVLSLEDLRRLLAIKHDINDAAVLSAGANPTDAEVLDLLNFVLSAPEWSVSFLEDICEIVRASGRTEIRGAQWTRH